MLAVLIVLCMPRLVLWGVPFAPPQPQTLDPVFINVASLDRINNFNCVAGTCHVNVGMQSWHVQHTRDEVIAMIGRAIEAASIPRVA